MSSGRVNSGTRGFGRGNDCRVVQSVAIDDRLGAGKTHRPVGGADHADVRIVRFAAVPIVKHRRRRQGEITVPAAKTRQSRSAAKPATPAGGAR